MAKDSPFYGSLTRKSQYKKMLIVSADDRTSLPKIDGAYGRLAHLVSTGPITQWSWYVNHNYFACIIY